LGPSAYFMKSPPVQYHDDVAHAMVEAFAAGEDPEG
jgi:myo-inositol-1-phosphate synthase